MTHPDYSLLLTEARAVREVSTELGDFPDTSLELISRLVEALSASETTLSEAVAAVGLPEEASLEQLIEHHRVSARFAGVLEGMANANEAATTFEAPGGWFPFGSHLDFAGPLQFSVETSEDGLPRWERPLPLAFNADSSVPAEPITSLEKD